MSLSTSNKSSSRISEDEMLLQVAATFALRSTCSRGQTGCVIALDGRVLSSGYNGAPKGMPHCDHSCDCGAQVETEYTIMTELPHHPSCRWLKPCTTAVHGEANAIAFAARHGARLQGSTLYTALLPCIECARLIVNVDVVRVVALAERGPAPNSLVGTGREFLEKAGIEVVIYDARD